jgi:pheromone a factor receptor
MSVFILYVNIEEHGLRPWISWENVHEDWLNVYQYPRVLVPEYTWNDTLAVWYIIPLTSVIFFAFFGFGREARDEYVNGYKWIQARLFRMMPKKNLILPIS